MTGRMLESERHRSCGFTLLELLVVLVAGSLLLAGLGGVVGQSLRTWSVVSERKDLTQQARFAMHRMVTAANGTSRLLLPLPENPATGYSESVRDVLAVTLAPDLDRDRDGFADADNDRDGIVDEDFDNDNTNDGAPGAAADIARLRILLKDLLELSVPVIQPIAVKSALMIGSVVDQLFQHHQRPDVGLVAGLGNQLLLATEVEETAGAQRCSLELL